ncbi:MAG TPA: efflux RND transporter periplasmic adaptor subunit [Bryobacteraceae bacterium]|nr:efflux RND transporter periplasmic adaptor subunit [Bryobacteraceae bacterium]
MRKWLFGAVALIVVAGVGIVIARRERRQVVAVPPPTEANFVGAVQPRATVAVGAPAAGVLDNYFVDPGQQVFQGQLLGKLRNDQAEEAQKKAQADLDQAQESVTNLNSELLAAKLESSRATADQARLRNEIGRLEKEYTLQKQYWDEGITPRLTYEKAERDYLAAKMDLDQQDALASRAKDRLAELANEIDAAHHAIKEASEALDHAKSATQGAELHSPSDGMVVAKRGQPGDTVDPSMQDLVKIAPDLTALEVDASPGPEVLSRMRAGQAVRVRVPELSAEEMTGVVREVRGPQVIIDFTSPAPIAKLDLVAQVRIKF